MKGTLYIQRDTTGKRIEKPQGIECELLFGSKFASDHIAHAFNSDEVAIAKLLRAEVTCITADSLFFFGVDRISPTVLRYQE